MVQGNRNCLFCILCGGIGCGAASFHYLVNLFMVTKNPYWLVHLVMFDVFVPLTLSSIFAAVVLVCSECDLLKRNIEAYKQLVDVMCLQVDLVGDKVRSEAKSLKLSQNEEGDNDSVHAAVTKAVMNDPIVSALQDQ